MRQCIEEVITQQQYKKHQLLGRHFYATGLFLYPLKTSENIWFVMYANGIEREKWHAMG